MTALNTDTHWAEAAQALQASGHAYVIVTVLGTKGSTPRATATKMVISQDERFGTIGGGHGAEVVGAEYNNGLFHLRLRPFLASSNRLPCATS